MPSLTKRDPRWIVGELHTERMHTKAFINQHVGVLAPETVQCAIEYRKLLASQIAALNNIINSSES